MTVLTDIKGLGPATLSKLKQSSIETIEDLLKCFPKAYKDQNIQSIDDAKIGEKITFKAKVINNPSVFFFRKKLSKLSVKVSANQHVFRVDIFNRHFLSKLLFNNVEVVLTGQFKTSFKVFTASDMVLSKNFEEGIIPEYRLPDIKDGRMRKIIHEALKHQKIDENLPEALLKKRRINDIQHVLRFIHEPQNHDELKQAIQRLKYEEFIYFASRIELIKNMQLMHRLSKKTYQIDKVRRLIKNIGFELTNSQKRATNDIFRDLKSPHQMNRLLQGDVGSGKTIVAILAALAAVTAGYQVAVMAPTLVLANQHLQVFNQYLSALKVRIALLTSETSNHEKQNILNQITNHELDIVIGTHALIQDPIDFNLLGFVIIDEQHRFGVDQRRKLREKGLHPDLLLMSATPIPRSLAISIFESSDVSQITEKPAGRKAIQTQIVTAQSLKEVYAKIQFEISQSHQTYVICPLIEENEESNYYSVEETLSMFQSRFPNAQVEALHGRMTDQEKMDRLADFKNGQIQILVSTTVIEVGIHVDRATTMVIMNANAFGLAQLHQLRGRIGRNDLQSYCYLVVNEGAEDIERLSILENEDDGFKIAAYDLKLRGPGEVFGKNQAGIPNFNFANLIEDQLMLKHALEDAKWLIEATDSRSLYIKNTVKKTIKSYQLD